MQTTPENRILEHLTFLYGEAQAREILPVLQDKLEAFRQRNPGLWQVKGDELPLSEQDAILITYGDQIQEPGAAPLQSLANFLEQYLKEEIRGVHILPFYPYSSDDGFSVIDYRQVNPALGTWEDVSALGGHFRLMFDAVINHISRQSQWFKAFQIGEAPYDEFFIRVGAEDDLSKVVRPRTLPLLTRVKSGESTWDVWTTFSEDQIDLNYANPAVTLEILDLLLFYVEHGAELIRLDAIAYLWKEPGTTCIHLPQTHHMVKLFRAVLDAVAPQVLLITETNVPHRENIEYFGAPLPRSDLTDEAQLVYQFPLAPLVLYSFLSENARLLSQWAAGLETPAAGATYFNFLASHDGIGVRPAEGILQPEEVSRLVEQVLSHGGQASYRTHTDGSQSVYELNTTWYDALNDPRDPDQYLGVRRFLASQAIMVSIAGVPGIYFHSLFGSGSCQECFRQTGRARSLNREKFQLKELLSSLGDAASRQAQVFTGFSQMLRVRRDQPAFHPAAGQKVLFLHDSVFSVLRSSRDGSQQVLCLINVSGSRLKVSLLTPELGWTDRSMFTELLSGEEIVFSGERYEMLLEPYQVMWLSASREE